MSLKYTAATVRKVKARSSLVLPFLLRESPASLEQRAQDSTSPAPFASSSTSNPFLPTKTPGARSWTAPKYSLRRQKALRREVEALGWSQDILPQGAAPKPASVASSQKITSSAHVKGSAVLDAVGLLKSGPYAGRKGMAFKGKMWERKFEARQQQLATLLEGAEAKEAAWRKAKLDEKAKAKPALPF